MTSSTPQAVVAVFCGASEGISGLDILAAQDLGASLHKANIKLVSISKI